jgi:hypothetical protein
MNDDVSDGKNNWQQSPVIENRKGNTPEIECEHLEQILKLVPP